MSSRISRMQKLVELADMELDKAAQTLAALQEQYVQESSQLEALTSYIEEYSNQPLTNSILVTSIQLQTRLGFSEKLRQAVEAQKIKVQQLIEIVEKGREDWLEKKVRVQSLMRLLDKLKRSHQAKLDKQEQRMLDELAAQSVILRRKDS